MKPVGYCGKREEGRNMISDFHCEACGRGVVMTMRFYSIYYCDSCFPKIWDQLPTVDGVTLI